MARARSLAELQNSFPDEESCAAFLFKQRWPDGFVCPGCGKRRVVGLKSRPRLHECLDLRPADLGYGGDDDASLQAAADDLVLGSASHDNPFQRNVGASIGGPTRRHLQDRMAADAKVAAIDGRSESGTARTGR